MTIGVPNEASAAPLASSAAATSFEEYVRSRSVVLVRMACLVTRDWEEARDAVQDALVSLYPRWDGLDPARLDAYVHRSVTNACLMRLRRVRRVRPVGEPSVLLLAAVASDPAEGLAVADQAWRLCAELPATQRAAVVLRFYRDLSFAEVGEALGCPEGTARSHVHQALATLRERHGSGADHG